MTPRERFEAICLALPEATHEGDQNRTYRVRRRAFAYLLDDHQGDGILAGAVKSTPDEREALLATGPAVFYVPAYVGRYGWIAMRFDTGPVDWSEVSELVGASYDLVAPRALRR